MTERTYGAGPPPQPRWSICVPTYRRANSIAAALQSAIQQRGERIDPRSVEIVVAENASDDHTEQVIEELNAPQVRLLKYQNLASMYANHNRAIGQARGRWVLFLHSDDVLPPGYLQHLDRRIEADRSVDLLTELSLADFPIDLEELTGDGEADRRIPRMIAAVLLAGGGPPSGSAYRRDAFETGGEFDDDHLFADATLLIRWILAGHRIEHFRFDPPVYSVKADSTTASVSFMKNYWRDSHIKFDMAFDGNRGAEVQRACRDLFVSLPPNQQPFVLYGCILAGRRRFAFNLLRKNPSTWRCMTQRYFFIKVLPAALAPRPYHALRWRIYRARKCLDDFRKRDRSDSGVDFDAGAGAGIDRS